MSTARGYAAHEPTSDLAPFAFERRALRDNDVDIDIQFCGVCHSDLHTCRNDWKGTRYPIVPGHEIIGTVRAVGAANGANPEGVVVPCHRVIGADGSLTGYGGGMERKRWLLAHEAAHSSTPRYGESA